MSFKNSIFPGLLLGTVALNTTACAPVLVAGTGVSAVTAAAKEKGISGSLSDTQISTSLKLKIYQRDPELHQRVGINVQNGEVLLTGSLPNQKLIDDVEQITWSIEGVKKVINQLGIKADNELGLVEGSTDSWITTQIKSALLFSGDINSINYSIKTVSGVVYVMGIAQNQAELDKVLNVAKNTRGVKKVINYAKLKQLAL